MGFFSLKINFVFRLNSLFFASNLFKKSLPNTLDTPLWFPFEFCWNTKKRKKVWKKKKTIIVFRTLEQTNLSLVFSKLFASSFLAVNFQAEETPSKFKSYFNIKEFSFTGSIYSLNFILIIKTSKFWITQ